MQVPPGFASREVDGAIVVGRNGLLDFLVGAGVARPRELAAARPAAQQGRGRLGRLPLPPAGAALVRPLRRGGLLGKVVRHRSLDPWRAVAELAVSAEAEARGAAVLEVLAAVTRRRGLGYEHALVTREVEGACDLAQALAAAPCPARRAAALVAAARAVRSLHDAGVDHVDLNLKNVLLLPGPRALVIDLDRCRIGREDLPWPRRRANLLRLLRSWHKLAAACGSAFPARDPLCFAAAYARGDRVLLRRLVDAGAGARFPLRRLLWSLRPPSPP
ncbi:MAG: hypothetical protein D6731_23570 [Planctomycetota bacterium]|nr:MAG: hypothetical protein D6731_23570 [Planctomycetota bacterium]